MTLINFTDSIDEYRRISQEGEIPKAYAGLIRFMLDLRSAFNTMHPELAVSGNFYQGYMDLTFFTLHPEFLKVRKLKIVVVFMHQPFRFEVWLAGVNRKVRDQYLNQFKNLNTALHRLTLSRSGRDSILETILADNPDFSDVSKLTEQLVNGTMAFIREVQEIAGGTGG